MTRKRKPNLPEGDDGRTIASMNVEGMPWYTPDRDGQTDRTSSEAHDQKHDVLNAEQSRIYTFGALKAALLVTCVMLAGVVLFVLFCQFVWFRS